MTNALILSGLTALVLSPLLNTGYVSDDITNSMVPGMLKLQGDPMLVSALARTDYDLLQKGRFFPLQLAEIWTVFYLIPNLTAYKIFTILAVVANVAFFVAFLRQVTKCGDFAASAAVALLALFQVRAYYDPFLSFAGVQQFLFGTFILSLMAFHRYLERGRILWLLAAMAAYLIALLTYEATYPFFLIYFVMACRHRPAWKSRLVLTAPFAAMAIGCVLTTVLARILFMTESDPYRVSTDVTAFLRTLLWQTTAALPLSYFLADPAAVFPSLWDARGLSKLLGSTAAWLVFAGVAAAAYRSFRVRVEGEGPPSESSVYMAVLGLALVVLPALLVSVSVRYQGEIKPGKGYIPVYFQYYGVAILFATAARGVIARAGARSDAVRRRRLLTSLAVAAVATLTYRANARVAELITVPPGSPGFNAIVGEVQGCYHVHRLNLEAAFREGLVEEVPDGSVVMLANEYHWWFERIHAAQLFAMHASKRVTAVPRQETFMPTEPPTREAILANAPAGEPYLLRDVALDRESGYVILSGGPSEARSPSARGGGELRLFVRHPRLFAHGPTPAVVLREKQAPEEETSPGFSRQGHELKVIRSGPDWALFSLRSEAGSVDPDSLEVFFGPVAVDWGEGFDYPEAGPEGWWRWCRRRGTLTLRNLTEKPRRVRVAMLLHGNGDGRIVIESPFSHEAIVAGPTPSRFVREFTLPPGSHDLTFTAEGSPYVEPPQSPRRIYFRLLNFRFEDRGAAGAMDH